MIYLNKKTNRLQTISETAYKLLGDKRRKNFIPHEQIKQTAPPEYSKPIQPKDGQNDSNGKGKGRKPSKEIPVQDSGNED